MVVVEGKNSLEFHPQGDRFTYHTVDDPAIELVALKNVLDFCDKLGEAFLNIFANAQLGNAWWTTALIMDGDAAGRVPITEVKKKANLMLDNGAIRRSSLPQVKAKSPNGIFFANSGLTPFPLEDTNPTGPANEKVLKFSVDVADTSVREYYIGTDGKLHCKGLLPLSMNGKPLLLTDGDFADGAIEVMYCVDFIPRP